MPIPYAPQAARKDIEDYLRYVADVFRRHSDLDALWSEPVQFGFDATAAKADDLRERYGEPFRLAIVGEFKAGKSALINALLGRPGLVPEGATPTTGVITELWWAESEGGRVLGSTGQETFAGSLAETVSYADQRSPQGRRVSGRGARVVLGVCEDFLKNLIILDTPGMGADPRDDQVTLDSLHLADAAVLVVNGLQPGGEESLLLSELLRTTERKLITVVTRIDLAASPDDALDAAKQVFGAVSAGDPVGVASPAILAALDALRAAEAERDGAGIDAANEALRDSGYFALRERLQDALFAGQAAAPRTVVTLAEVREKLAALSRGAAREAGVAQRRADELTQELSEAQKHIHDVLWPKVPFLAGKIDEAVDIHVGEFVTDLGDAVDVFLDRVADGGLGLGFRSLAARVSDRQQRLLQQRMKAEFQEIFPNDQLDVTIALITRSVRTLMEYEWRDAATRALSVNDPVGYDPTTVVRQVTDHVARLTTALTAQLVAWVTLLLVPGGALVELAWLMLTAGAGAMANESRKGGARLVRAKREARLQIRGNRKKLSYELADQYRRINADIARELIARADRAASAKQTRASELLATAERWRGVVQDAHRLVDAGEELASGGTP